MATTLESRNTSGRSAYGLPTTRQRRKGVAVLGWLLALLAGLTAIWRTLRWADRNL